MNISVDRDRRVRAALEAAEWVLRLQDPRVTRSEPAEYVQWFRESVARGPSSPSSGQ